MKFAKKLGNKVPSLVRKSYAILIVHFTKSEDKTIASNAFQ